MVGKGKVGWVVLASASVAATAGTVWLAVQALEEAPDWVATAAASPLAVRCLVVIVAGLAVLGLLAALAVRARVALRLPRGFHADQGGTAAIEMAFVLPLALMVFLVITQSALVFNANMVVHYATYAAARVATVVVPMELDGWERWNLVSNPDVGTSAASQKLEMIRQGAVLALVPVSSRQGADAAAMGGGSAASIDGATRSAFSALGGRDRAWFKRIEAQHAYADAYTKIEIAKPEHWRGGNLDEGCPYRQTDWQHEWGEHGWESYSYCPYHPDRMDYHYFEDLHLRVTYQFLLEIPYAGRIFGQTMSLPGATGTKYATEIKVHVSLSNEGGWEVQPRDAP